MTHHGGQTMRPEPVFKDFLDAIADMTLDDLQAAIDVLPADLRAKLALGPYPARYACRICGAFGRAWFMGTPDPADPRWRAWGYHEIPKRLMTTRRELWYGPLADEIFDRVVATYWAAGWTGEP